MTTEQEPLRGLAFGEKTENTVTVTATLDKRDNPEGMLNDFTFFGGVLFGPQLFYMLLLKNQIETAYQEWAVQNPEADLKTCPLNEDFIAINVDVREIVEDMRRVIQEGFFTTTPVSITAEA